MTRVVQQGRRDFLIFLAEANHTDLRIGGAFHVADLRRAKRLVFVCIKPRHHHLAVTLHRAAVECEIVAHRTPHPDLRRLARRVRLDDRLHDPLHRPLAKSALRSPQIFMLGRHVGEVFIEDEVAYGRRGMRLRKVHEDRFARDAGLCRGGVADLVVPPPGEDFEVDRDDARALSLALENHRPCEERVRDGLGFAEHAPRASQVRTHGRGDIDHR